VISPSPDRVSSSTHSNSAQGVLHYHTFWGGQLHCRSQLETEKCRCPRSERDFCLELAIWVRPRLVISTYPTSTFLLSACCVTVSKFTLHLVLLQAWTHRCQDLVLSYALCVCYPTLQTECSVTLELFGQHAAMTYSVN
jgi:hypothetical protein